MILKYKGYKNTWVLLQGKIISYSRFIVQPDEMRGLTIIDNHTEEIPEEAEVELTDDVFMFRDLLKQKLVEECDIVPDDANVHCCYEEPEDKSDIALVIAVLVDDKEVYLLNGDERAYILNDDGKTIEKI